ncbi:hypothetical protein FQZ97_991440 [compost metagenome]
MKACALFTCLASLGMAMVSMKTRPPPVGSSGMISSLPPVSFTRSPAMLMSPDQPMKAQALPPAMSSIMVLENRRTSLRTFLSISPASLKSSGFSL